MFFKCSLLMDVNGVFLSYKTTNKPVVNWSFILPQWYASIPKFDMRAVFLKRSESNQVKSDRFVHVKKVLPLLNHFVKSSGAHVNFISYLTNCSEQDYIRARFQYHLLKLDQQIPCFCVPRAATRSLLLHVQWKGSVFGIHVSYLQIMSRLR